MSRIIAGVIIFFLVPFLGAQDIEFQLLKARSGLPVPVRDAELDKTARDYAEELAAWGRLSHRDPRGGDAAQRFAWTGRLGQVGEILGASGTLEALVPAWLESRGHREVLLDARWTAWGWGLAPYGNSWVAVVMFFRPD